MRCVLFLSINYGLMKYVTKAFHNVMGIHFIVSENE